MILTTDEQTTLADVGTIFEALGEGVGKAAPDVDLLSRAVVVGELGGGKVEKRSIAYQDN